MQSTSHLVLRMTTRPKADVAFTESAVSVAEGATRALTLTRSGPGSQRGGDLAGLKSGLVAKRGRNV